MYDFSIIVPTYGRAGSLDRLLLALTGLDYPPDRFEVIVVDDGGPVALDATTGAYRERLNLSLAWQANSGPGAARNHGAQQAKGRYLAFTDDDCQPDPGWLRQMAAALEGSSGAICGGKTFNRYTENLPAQATQLLMDYLYEHYNPIERLGAFYPTNNLAVPRDEFLKLGGFDGRLRFGEDRDLCYRWQLQGRPFVFAPRAVVQHGHALNFLTFVQLHFCYGRGTGQFRTVCKRKGLGSAGFSSPSWYLGLVLSGIRKEPGWRGAALSSLLVVSQAASAAGFAWTAFKTALGPPTCTASPNRS
jgi:glycosyltransferase involved in cell wall biosynthesis